MQFRRVAAILCGRGGRELPVERDSIAAEPWFFFGAHEGARRRKNKEQERGAPPLMPRYRGRKRRNRATVNRMGRQRVRRHSADHDAPERPEKWRARMIRAAWQNNDYVTLYQMGEIPTMPEFD